MANLREFLDMLNKLDDELAVGYHNLPFNQDIRDAPTPAGFKRDNELAVGYHN